MSERDESDVFPYGIAVIYARLTNVVASADLTAVLLNLRQPAVVTVDDWGDEQWAEVLLPLDESGQALSVEINSPTFRWRPQPVSTLAGILARDLATEVVYGEDIYGRDGAASPASDLTVVPGEAEAVVWFAKLDSPRLVGIVARTAGRQLAWAKVDGGCVISDLVSPQATLDSGAWAIESEVVLWTSGAARGAGILFRKEPYFHVWQESPTVVDPTKPWHRDGAGLTVAEYSVPLPSHCEEDVWIRRFGLDAGRAERLRILFRQLEPTAETFTLLTDILGIGPVVAEVAEGVTHISELDGVVIVEPTTGWQTFRKSMAAGDGNRADSWWRRLRATHPRWSMAIVVAVEVFAVGFLLSNLIDGDYWGMLLAAVVAAVWARELFLRQPHVPLNGDELLAREKDRRPSS